MTDNLRCSLMRCVSSLVVIQELTGTSEPVTLDNITINCSYLRCLSKCKDWIYECLTCNNEVDNIKKAKQKTRQKKVMRDQRGEIMSSPEEMITSNDDSGQNKTRFLVCVGCKLKCHKGHCLETTGVENVTKCMCIKC